MHPGKTNYIEPWLSVTTGGVLHLKTKLFSCGLKASEWGKHTLSQNNPTRNFLKGIHFQYRYCNLCHETQWFAGGTGPGWRRRRTAKGRAGGSAAGAGQRGRAAGRSPPHHRPREPPHLPAWPQAKTQRESKAGKPLGKDRATKRRKVGKIVCFMNTLHFPPTPPHYFLFFSQKSS